jgi:mono/diheme cytochrome c family protein
VKLVLASALLAMTMTVAAPADAQDQAKIEHGKQVYQYWCATCHGPGIGANGVQHLPGTNALLAKYKGEKPALLEERTDLTPELVKFFVRNGVSIMPQFRKVEVSDPDLDAIAAYLTRNNK